MRKFLKALVLVPLAVLFIVFAIANRRLVTVSFDPFNTGDPSVGLTLPLFVVLITTAIVGVVAGGVAGWFRNRHLRREVRRHEAEAQAARTELVAAQHQLRQHSYDAALAAPVEPSRSAPNYPALPRDNRAGVL